MAKAKAEITISKIIDIERTARYYLLQSSTASAPSKPTTNPPGGSWSTTEPSYTSGSTSTLYFVDLTVMSDDSFSYSAVSKSSSYEAAKAAYNKASNVEKTVTDFKQTSEGWQMNWDKILNRKDANTSKHTDYITFKDGDIKLGDSSSSKSLEISNETVDVKNEDDIVASFGEESSFYSRGKTGQGFITFIGSRGIRQSIGDEIVLKLGFDVLCPDHGDIPHASYTLGSRDYTCKYDQDGNVVMDENGNEIPPSEEEKKMMNGWMSTVLGEYGIAVGDDSVSMSGGHAFGTGSVAIHYGDAIGAGSVAIGFCTARKDYSFAVGKGTHANGECSATFGSENYAMHPNEFVIGKCNNYYDKNTPNDGYAFVIGNGTDRKKDRSNAHTVDWDGNAYYSGGVKASSFNGHTLSSDVPENAKFTDTNTWRPVVDNLTSDDTDKSLSAKQGKTLKSAIDTIASSKQIGTVTCTAKANTPTATHVNFPKAFASAPIVLLNPLTAVPGTIFKGCSATNITTTGFDLYVTRTDNGNTSVKWIAII